MKQIYFPLLIFVFMFTNTSASSVRKKYDLTVKVVIEATKGWDLYQQGKFAGKFNGGKYTDPDIKTRVKDFWSDGLFAKYDRDNNGHFETIFIIREKKLIYIGSIGPSGTFVHVANRYHKFINKPVSKIYEIER